MFISIPNPFIKACIAAADACGLAVNICICSVPNLSANFCTLLKKGPGLPPITLLNSLKSNLASSDSNAACCLANSAGVIF